MPRVLLTGATGFLGSRVLETLLAHRYDVVALCRGEADELARRGVTVRGGDVTDAGSVQDAAAGCEGVLHCAGMVSRRPEDAEELHRQHVIGTRAVLEACRAAGVRRAVIASTSGTIA